ncbi:MAG: glycosyltransferase [Actinomycetota bacterium]|nr:glycosyltransferase [Actinomycetota bacterium]
MRVAIDMISAGRGFGPSAGAMVVYYSGILKGLLSVPAVEKAVALVSPWNAGLAIPNHPKVETFTCRGLPENRVGRVLYEQGALAPIVARVDVDALLSTCNTTPLLKRRPSVVVLQSLQYLHFPSQFGRVRAAYLRAMVARSLTAADAVITVSHWARSEAIRLFGLDPSRVFTVYHGVSDAVRGVATIDERPERPALPGDAPYVLMVSSFYGFKNHRRLVRAFADVVASTGVPHRLVLVGGDADVAGRELAVLADSLGVGDRMVLTGALSHEQVPAFVAHADAVVYPSLYETFGLPVLEALAMGRPVVTSDHGPMAEIAGGAARLVDAEDVESISKGLADVMLDERLRVELAEAGPRRAAEFTWETAARETVSVIETAIERHAGRVRSRSAGERREDYWASMQGSVFSSQSAYSEAPHLRIPTVRELIATTLQELVTDAIARKGACRALDLGAGHGHFTDELLGAGATVVASEMSEASAAELSRKYQDRGDVEVVFDRDGEQVFESGGAFDLVVCVSLLHHIPDYLEFVERLAAVILDGGAFASFQDPLLYATQGRAARLIHKAGFYAWRIRQGNLRRGFRTTVRRLRGVLDETNPSDMVEYHVVRDGVDQESLRALLLHSFDDVRLVRYWSTPAPTIQQLGKRLGLESEFGLVARGRRASATGNAGDRSPRVAGIQGGIVEASRPSRYAPRR